MPSVQPGTLRSNELPEFPIRGPFGGIQSELPPEFIERFGFLDALNVVFHKGVFAVRPAFTEFPPMPAPQEAILGVMEFNGAVVLTKSRLLTFDGTNWTNIPSSGAGLSGTDADKFTFAIIGDKLCFCQGVDKVQMWDGINPWGAASANAVPARFLAEIDTHLMVAHTIEAGIDSPQRIRWTAAGDPTDWIGFNAGQHDRFNALGPLTGISQSGQLGVAWQFKGIGLVQPTGIGTNPFNFIPIMKGQIGLVFPYTLDVSGDGTSYFVGQDNVYTFNTSSGFVPIGDMPAQGRIRLGARSRIFADFTGMGLDEVYGAYVTELGDVGFRSYWILIPHRSIWVFDDEEATWTRFSLTGFKTESIGMVTLTKEILIQDLIGSIDDQNWQFNKLGSSTAPADALAIGTEEGTLFGWSFSNAPTEAPWKVTSGQLACGDYRHVKEFTKLRLVFQDVEADVQVAIHVTGYTGEEKQEIDLDATQLILGTGSGKSVTQVVDMVITAMFLEIEISGAGQFISFSEVTPIYDIGGEAVTNG